MALNGIKMNKSQNLYFDTYLHVSSVFSILRTFVQATGLHLGWSRDLEENERILWKIYGPKERRMDDFLEIIFLLQYRGLSIYKN